MTETDPLKLLYRRLRDNVTQGVAGDVMQMPPSWGELLTAVHEAAFPDGDEPEPQTEPEPMPLTVPEPIAGLLRGIGERLDAGQEVVFLSSGEAYAKGRDAGYAAGAKAQREADRRQLLVSRGGGFAAWLLDGRPLVTDNTDDSTDDSTDDFTTVTSGIEAVKLIRYAEGWDAGYSEGHAEGYRDAVERFGADAAERLEADRALAVEVRDRGIAILDDLEAQDLAEAGQCEPRHEQRWKYAYAAHRLRQAKELIIEGDMK